PAPSLARHRRSMPAREGRPDRSASRLPRVPATRGPSVLVWLGLALLQVLGSLLRRGEIDHAPGPGEPRGLQRPVHGLFRVLRRSRASPGWLLLVRPWVLARDRAELTDVPQPGVGPPRPQTQRYDVDGIHPLDQPD